MNVEQMWWNWYCYGKLIEAGIVANIWLTQLTGGLGIG